MHGILKPSNNSNEVLSYEEIEAHICLSYQGIVVLSLEVIVFNSHVISPWMAEW